MATYTTPLRVLIEQATQYEEGLSWNERIEVGRKKLFDFDYPFFDEDYKRQFETNIIRKFYMREIGFETENLFKFQLETWLNINMPYFNQLLESEKMKFDPLMNSYMETAHKKKNDREQNDLRNIDSEQNDLRNIDYEQNDLRNIDQSSNTHGTGNTESEQSGNVDTTQNSVTSSEQERDYLSDKDETHNIDKTENQTHNTDNTQNENQFNRKLDSDTPQSRLQITTGEGIGIIEYASSIEEDKMNRQVEGNESGKLDTESGETGSKNTDVIDNEKTVSSSETDSSSNRKDKIDFQSQDETNVDSTTEQEDKYNSEKSEEDKYNSERTQEDRYKSEQNEMEDYFQKRVGKIGVQSYSKLLMEYRESFLRIENMIHNELQELFMLVY